MYHFNFAGIPPRARGAALIDIVRRLGEAPTEERDIQALVIDPNMIVFSLLHP